MNGGGEVGGMRIGRETDAPVALCPPHILPAATIENCQLTSHLRHGIAHEEVLFSRL
jgi:hypothetical protein